SEYHAVHGADPRASQHSDHRLRYHRHIQDDAVALGDAEITHHGGERLHFAEELGICEFRNRVGERRIVDQRELITASAGNVTIKRVVAGIDDGTVKPAAVDATGRIEDLLCGLDPVDLARSLCPEPLGIPERADIDVAVSAFLVNVHRTSLPLALAYHVPT